MTTQSHAEFTANWDRQLGCPAHMTRHERRSLVGDDQVRSGRRNLGDRRAPRASVTNWGWTTAVVAKMNVPTLAVSGAHDKQVAPERVRNLYADLGSKQKVFIDLACSSHNAMWEKNHLLLFQASLEWLSKGTVNGMEQGMIKLGY